MKVIVFQGNFPDKYKSTRHNIGFCLADFLCQKHNGQWIDKPKFNAKLAEIKLGDQKILLVKPQTFYNETGTATRRICDFYKLNWRQDLLVVHDDLSLDFGTIRVRLSGSDGGNNGLKSIIANLGQDFSRIKIGIANPLLHLIDSANFVLANFSSEEQQKTEAIFEVCEDFIADFAKNKLKNEKRLINR